MKTSIKDKEAWITEKAEEIARDLGGAFQGRILKTTEEIGTMAYRWAEGAYINALAGYAESSCERDR